jgi:hypothetical protein
VLSLMPTKATSHSGVRFTLDGLRIVIFIFGEQFTKQIQDVNPFVTCCLIICSADDHFRLTEPPVQQTAILPEVDVP